MQPCDARGTAHVQLVVAAQPSPAMLQHFENPDLIASDAATADTDPLIVALIATLADCCHPRAERLKVRLLDCRDADQLALLKGEVLNLLALSFGPAEAMRRLQSLQ